LWSMPTDPDPDDYMLVGLGGEGGSEVTMLKAHHVEIRRDSDGVVQAVDCRTCGWTVTAAGLDDWAFTVWRAHVNQTAELLGLVSPN
jgi:hypothetical protein